MKQINWKRSIAALGLTLAMALPTAVAVSNVPIGTVVDHVLYTDIVALIDNYAIPSYNVSNRTVIAAEDLLAYGFNVVWSNADRTLSISLDTTGKEVTANYTPEANTHTIGAIAGDVLATDIVTKVTDYWGCTYEIPSWNIGNKTAVSMNDLAKAFSSYYNWDETERVVRMFSKRYTAWSRDLSAPAASNELKRGFAVKVTGFGADSKVEGEGSWGGVDHLTLSPTGVSFSVSQRVLGNYDGCLDKLNAEVAAYDSIRDGSIQNRKELTPEQQLELRKYIRVYRTEASGDYGSYYDGELWISHGDGQTNYTYRFSAPVEFSEGDNLYIVAGDALWVADQMMPLEWTTRGLAAARCDVLTSDLAHVYYCHREGIRDGNESLTVVWPDGTTREYLSEMEGLGMFGRTENYYIENLQLSADGKMLTFRCPVYELHGELYSPDYRLEKKGVGTYRVDLVTRELTLESIAAD